MRTIALALIAISLGLAGLTLSTAAAQPADAGIEVPADASVSNTGSDAGSGSASATKLPDPIAQPVESVSFVVKLWKSGTLAATLIVALFLGLTAASRKIKFLQSGYAAVVTAALLGGCTMLVERAAEGTTPTAAMFLSALVTAVALALKPKQPMGPPATETELAK